MEHDQSEHGLHGSDKTTGEFGSPIRQTVDPVHKGTTDAGDGSHGTATGPTGFAATTAGGHGFPIQHYESSSSSEDDGNGGRRKKKGLEDELPVDTNRSIDPHGATTTLYGGQDQEKGIIEKIKEKLKSIIDRLFYNNL